MNRLYEWWSEHQRIVGTAVGSLNLLVSLLFLSMGDELMAAFWAIIAIFILIDTWSEA